MKKPLNVYVTILALSWSLLLSCKKFLEVSAPANQLVSASVFENNGTAVAAVTGIYVEMMNNSQQFANNFTTLFAGMSSDELRFWSSSFRDEFVTNNISEINHPFLASAFWGRAYQYIYAANSCIEGLKASRNVTDSIRKSLIAEAKFVRTFSYYYLVNLFGEVPLILATDHEINGIMARTSVEHLYSQMIEDLREGVELLASNYTSGERTRPNKFAAAALLSRIYLHLQDWDNAEKLATEIITSSNYSLLSSLNNVFLKNSREAIWQLQPVNPVYNTWEGFAIITAATVAPTYVLTNQLYQAFENGDNRKSAWVGTKTVSGQPVFFPSKYKVPGGNSAPVTEYYTILRLAEIILIRAEARNNKGDFAGAVSDVNMIRNRAGLPNTLATNSTNLTSAIEQERRIELFAEWGHRWFDLKRTGRAEAVLAPLKGSTWNANDLLWPIPTTQLNLNSSLVQNPGY